MTASQRYEEDIQCLVAEKNGRGGIYIGNLEAAQNLSTLSSNNRLTQNTASKQSFQSHEEVSLLIHKTTYRTTCIYPHWTVRSLTWLYTSPAHSTLSTETERNPMYSCQ